VDNYFELSFGRIHICEVSLRGRRETSENGENSGETPSQDEERIREQRENAGQIHLWEVSLRRRRETSEKRLGTNKKTKQGLKAWIPAGVYPREGGDGNDREERLRRKIHIMKSHFADEERLREWKDKEKRIGQIHICEVSLRGRRETSGKRLGTNTYYEVSLRGRRETSEKVHSEREERLRGDRGTKTKREFGEN